MFYALVAVFWLPLLGIAQTDAQTPAAPPSSVIPAAKLAWINLEAVIFSCEEGKREFTEIQKFVDAKNSELEALKKELDNLRNKLSVQGSKLTDEAREDLENEIEAKNTRLQRFQEDTQKEIDNRRVRTTNYIGRRMLPVIEKVSKEKGLAAVFYFNSSRDAWVDPSLNLTDEIVKAYNQTYPVSAAKAPAPASKP